MLRQAGAVERLAAIGPVALDEDNTPVSQDLLGADAADVEIDVGVGGITFTGTNKIEFTVLHSDAPAADFLPVGAADVVLGQNADPAVGAGGIVKSLVSAHAAPSRTIVSYIGGRRYLRVVAVFGGTHASPTPLAVSVTKRLLHRA